MTSLRGQLLHSQVSMPKLHGDSRLRSSDQYRLRTVQLMEKDENDVVKELETQLKAKDVLIEQLNDKLILAQSASKRTDLDSKDRPLKDVLDEKLKLVQDLADLQGLYSSQVSKHEEAVAALTAEKDALALQLQPVVEDNEAMALQLTVREESLATAKKDLVELSTIVKELTRLNSELNGKIAAMNEDIEKRNNENYAAVMKAKQVEEVEKELIEAKTEIQTLHAKFEDMRLAAAESKEAKGVLHSLTQSLVEQLSNVSLSDERTKLAVAAIDGQLKLAIPRAQEVREKATLKVAALKQEVMVLRSELATYKRAVSIALAEKHSHEALLSALRSDLAKQRSDYDSAVKYMEEKVRLIQSSVDYLLKTRKRVEVALETAKADCARKASEAEFYAGQMKGLRRWEADAKAAMSELQRSFATLQSRFAEVNKTCVELEHANSALRTDLRSALSKVAALKDELWKRDNKLLRKECKKLKLIEEVNSLRSTIQVSYTRFRSTETEDDRRKLPRVVKSQDGEKRKVPEDVLKRLEHALKAVKAPVVKINDKPRAVPVKALRNELVPYLRSVVSFSDLNDYSFLRDLYVLSSLSTMTVQEIIDEIAAAV